jgi:hypothetical protein
LHFVYLCKKKKEADELSSLNFDKVLEELKQQEKIELLCEEEEENNNNIEETGEIKEDRKEKDSEEYSYSDGLGEDDGSEVYQSVN